MRCELEEGGKPRQKGEKKGIKRMTGDKQGWGREKCRGRVDTEERARERGSERGDR